MSRREFLDFCFQVAHGEKNVVGDGAPDSPWMVMQNNIPTEIAKQVLTESITSLYPRVIGKRLIMREDILVDPEDLPDIRTKSYGHRVGHKVVVGKQNYTPEQLANSDTVTWADKYLFDQSLQYLTSHIGVDTSTIFIALTKKMYEEDLFLQETDYDRKEFCEFDIIHCMSQNVQNNVLWKNDEWGTKILGLHDVPAMRKYIENIGMFISLSIKLEDKGWRNNGARRPEQHVEKFLHFLTRVREYLARSSALSN